MSVTLHFPDLSEFQNVVNWPLLSAATPAVIIRALYGQSYVDKQWPANRNDAHANGMKAIGIYQYVRQDQDVVAQANAFCALVGTLQPGEFAIMDLEEGTGNQAARATSWLHTVDAKLTYPGYNGSWLYSYEQFVKDHGLLPIFRGSRHTWLADYTTTEPADAPHSLWQHSNGAVARCSHLPWPGAGFTDCNQFNGTIAQLLTKIAAPVPEPPMVRHYANGKHSLVQALNGLGITVEACARATVQNATPAEVVALAEYLAGGNWHSIEPVRVSKVGATAVMPDGMVFYAPATSG